jgi:putative acetyltransferase
MIFIRQEKKEDFEVIRDINSKAFGQPNEAQLVDNLRGTDNFIPELSLVAELNGKIVGHILFTRMVIESKSGKIPALSLAPVAVIPGHQNQGIGTELVKKGLEECRKLGHKIVIVVGHPNYYPRFGFYSARSRGLEAPFEVPDEAFMVLELEAGALEGVSGIIRYPKEFDEAM